MATSEIPSSSPSPSDPTGRLQQIDVLKGVAVLSVVATHSLSAAELVDSWAVLHIWQAVPLFIVILGANASMSFDRRVAAGAPRVFTREYLLSRMIRILAPFALIWALAWIVGRDKGRLLFGIESWVLQLPYPGRGNYFVPLVVALLLLAPLFYKAYRRWPWLTLVGLFAVDVAFELAAAGVVTFETRPFLYSVAFPRYLAAFALGFFIVDFRLSWRLRGTVLGAGTAGSLATCTPATPARGPRRSCPLGARRTSLPRSIPRPWPHSGSASYLGRATAHRSWRSRGSAGRATTCSWSRSCIL